MKLSIPILLILIVGLIILIVGEMLKKHMSTYYDKKLKDMNNCFDLSCEHCKKYKKTCKGREIKNEEKRN